MTHPPEDIQSLPPARRRRVRRGLSPLSAGERAAAQDALPRQLLPGVEFFIFSLFAGMVLAFGVWLNQPAIWIIGLVITPLLKPLAGIALGALTGAGRFLVNNLAGFWIGAISVWLGALAVGGVARLLDVDIQPAVFGGMWSNSLAVIVGALGLIIGLLRKRSSIRAFNIALSYGVYLPLAAAGFGLSAGFPWPAWLADLAMFGWLTALALVAGVLAFAVFGYRPKNMLAYVWIGLIGGATLILLVSQNGVPFFWGKSVSHGSNDNASLPAASPVAQAVLLPTWTSTPFKAEPVSTKNSTATAASTPQPTATPLIFTAMPTLEPTGGVTLAPASDSTFEAPPVFALVDTPEEYGGAIIRSQPGFNSPRVNVLGNGTLVQVLSDVAIQKDGVDWVEVWYPRDNLRGWIVRNLLLQATPAPNWNATITP